ncbi:MAG: hypothetical protein N2446_00890, partial [Elusimicrobiales bacterium]|nr:hypothetical protein [Elusimicrobiales bacterium]
KEKIWNSLEVDDRNEKNKENEFFNNVKPSNKFSKGEFPLNFIELPKAENFIVPFVRVKNLEDDIEISKSLIVTSVLDGIEGFKISLGANITQLNSLRNELKPLLDAFSQVQTPASQQPSNNQNNSQTQNNQQPQNNTQPTQPANNQNNSSSNLPPGFNLSWCNDISYNCKSKLCDVNMYELSRYRVPNYQIFCKDGEKISSCAQRIGISELNLQKACSLSNSSCKKIAENACIKSCINSVSKACQNKKK